ncbi:hypothetical protein WMY93_025155 [Mugilogobius chulae]|uniref:DUF4592 domain-containing protein n=1 Tax=Mugilogobius chulae TaxID=88201 RepID=A0AAW0NC59_9GOBI
MSQENVSDKVRNLQRQIASSIKFGQKPPSMRRSEGDEGSTDDEEVPRSPMKVQVQAQVQVQDEAEPPKPEPQHSAQPPAAPHSSPPAKSPRSKRVLSPTGTIESINLDAVPQSGPRLDNTAAKHKLSVKPKNQRVSRKHRRFTEDFQEVSIPGLLEEDLEAPCFSASNVQRRASATEPLQPSESTRRRQHEEEVRRRREEEERRQAEEERKRAEEQRIRELEEERRRREEEERLHREAEERREEEERRRAEEERKRREEEERRRREEEEEARRQQELLEKRLREEEEERRRKQEEERRRREEEEAKKRKEEEERRRREEEERVRKEKEEELRWKEMEERQKPFSFKVSSGEKQILFQKVNLTPVSPGSSHHQSGAVADHKESAKMASSEDSLSPSTYIPHTAILVTGAQLCGPAVNLDQIKDTACKSLLGLEEKKATPGTPTKNKTSPDRKSGKTKSLSEASYSTDQPGSDVLAEWASIRSKIFKGVEDGSYPDPEMTKPQPPAEEQPAFSHTHLRKTMSASAKFSITPAKKKFGDSNRNSEVYGSEDLSETPYECPVSPAPKPKSKSVRIVEKASDECVFAKDLPSFLVPGTKPDSEMLKTRTYSESYDSKDLEEDLSQDGEDAPSPFGIKLRRTNYSLRFHNDQSTEKRKKRYSDGDSFDGVPSPLTPIEPDSDVSSVFSERLSPMSPQKEGAVSKYIHSPRAKGAKSPSPIPHAESDKLISKPPVYRRPGTSPKPHGSVQTPPPSPLPKSHHGLHSPREAETQSREQVGVRGEETQRSGPGHSQGHSPGEEEPKEKKSFFPSINIPWREKTDRKTELIRKEKPSLQSRHSLDSAKVQEKEGAPLWIHLALQKQKGFREQQQNREDRRSQREAKLAEKQARERDSLTLPSPTESRGSGSISPSSKPQTPEEPKRPDSLLGRFERREQLKKANTLPSSVTVEIADSTPSPPAVKDVAKRFPSSDSAQVSTEPAWLALAKRKAKAWSDCPQIIK